MEDNPTQGAGQSGQGPAQQPTPAPQSANKNTGMAVVAYLLFFVPLLTDAKNDPFVKYHVKQGLVLFIGWIISWAIVIIPFLGLILNPIISIALLILLVVGIMNALAGRQTPLPVIGQYGEKFNF